MNPAAARQLLSIEPTVVLNAARRPKKEQRRRSAKTSGGNPVHQKKGACEVPHEVGYVCGRGARIALESAVHVKRVGQSVEDAQL